MSRVAWGILLAGGEGTRLRSITVDARGHHRPKQFCAFGSGRTLLRRAFDRSAAVVSPERVLPVVLEAHRAWWEPELAQLPTANITVQPANRGTAPAILLALLAVLERDPAAQIVIFPCDHMVEREEVLKRALLETLGAAGERIVLLGTYPQSADAELGWIRPAPVADSNLMRVAAFAEKPKPPIAAALLRCGGLVNTMMLVAGGAALLDLFRKVAPELLRLLGTDPDRPRRPSATRLQRAFQKMPTLDFSRDVLEQATRRHRRLWVSAVPRCGWSDLGTWEHLQPVCRRLGWSVAVLERASSTSGRLGPEYWLG